MLLGLSVTFPLKICITITKNLVTQLKLYNVFHGFVQDFNPPPNYRNYQIIYKRSINNCN